MKHEIVPLQESHIREIIARNKLVGVCLPESLSVDELVQVYLFPGSPASCLLVDDKPVAAGGIINLKWHRGEAWLLIAQDARKHFRAIIRLTKELLTTYAKSSDFHRIQATSYWNESRRLLTMFGFTPEGILKHYGPQGESAVIYARFFNE